MDDGTPHAELGARIRSARLRSGLTQQQLAEATGLAPRTVIRLEQGKHAPTPRNLDRIAGATGRPVDWFRAAPGGDRADDGAGGGGNGVGAADAAAGGRRDAA